MDDLTTKTSGGNEVRVSVYLSEYCNGPKQIWVARNFATDKHLNTSHSIQEVAGDPAPCLECEREKT